MLSLSDMQLAPLVLHRTFIELDLLLRRLRLNHLSATKS